MNENFEIKEKIKSIEDENKSLKNKINNLEIKINSSKNDLIALNKNNKLISINSAIMESNYELDMINSAIERKVNKEIIQIKKLYQSTEDGGDPVQFHELCNNIPNTLVLYKSAGERRFGGFVSKCWTLKGSIEDKNCFLFSLDKKKIYFQKKNIFQIENDPLYVPSFINKGHYIIQIDGNALTNKSLRTYEEYHKDIFDRDKNALSEDGKFCGVYAKECEVFKIIFK